MIRLMRAPVIFINNSVSGAVDVNFLVAPKMSSFPHPVETKMLEKLTENLKPEHLEIVNESYMHNVPKGSETHFKVVVVCNQFEGLPLIKRHRIINEILSEELKTGVHALSIVAKTPEKWQQSDKIVEPSPNCKGGFGK